MASTSKRGKKIEQLLGQVLDQREASEREREAMVMRLRRRPTRARRRRQGPGAVGTLVKHLFSPVSSMRAP